MTVLGRAVNANRWNFVRWYIEPSIVSQSIPVQIFQFTFLLCGRLGSKVYFWVKSGVGTPPSCEWYIQPKSKLLSYNEREIVWQLTIFWFLKKFQPVSWGQPRTCKIVEKISKQLAHIIYYNSRGEKAFKNQMIFVSCHTFAPIMIQISSNYAQRLLNGSVEFENFRGKVSKCMDKSFALHENTRSRLSVAFDSHTSMSWKEQRTCIW